MVKRLMVISLAILLAFCSIGITGFAAGETLTWDMVSNGQLQGFVESDLTVPTGWTLDSSDETVVRNNGKVTKGYEDQGATLTFTSGDKSVVFDVVVPSFADAENKNSLVANGDCTVSETGFTKTQNTDNGYTYTVVTPHNGKYRQTQSSQNYVYATKVPIYDDINDADATNDVTYYAYNKVPTSIETAGGFRFAVKNYSDSTVYALPVKTETVEGVEKMLVDYSRIETGKTGANYLYVVNNAPSYTQPSASNITFITETNYASSVSTSGLRFKEMSTDSKHYGIAKFIFKVGKASSSGWNQFDFSFRDVAQASSGGLQLTSSVSVINSTGTTVAKSNNFAYVGDPTGPDCVTDVNVLKHSASNPVVIGAWHELTFDVNAEKGYLRVYFDGKLAYWQYKNGEATEYSSKIALTDASGKTYLSTGWGKGEQWVNEAWAFASITSANSTAINYTKEVIANAMPYLPETPVKSDVLITSYPNVAISLSSAAFGTISDNLWTPTREAGWDLTEARVNVAGTYNTDQTTYDNFNAKIQQKTPVTIEKVVLKKDGKQVYGISEGTTLESVTIDAGNTSDYSIFAARYAGGTSLEALKKLSFTDGVATLTGFAFDEGDTFKIFAWGSTGLQPLSYTFNAPASVENGCKMFVIGDGVAKDAAALLGNKFNGITVDASEALVGQTAESALRVGSLKYVTDNASAGDYALISLANSIAYNSADNFEVLLRTMIDSVVYKGVTPVIVSPLVAEYAVIAQRVASECGVPYIDLNTANTDDAESLVEALLASIKTIGLPVATCIVAE